ncbi:MAG: hypothetical protein ACLRYY_06330 [Anaerobutyricum soehngenii]
MTIREVLMSVRERDGKMRGFEDFEYGKAGHFLDWKLHIDRAEFLRSETRVGRW